MCVCTHAYIQDAPMHAVCVYVCSYIQACIYIYMYMLYTHVNVHDFYHKCLGPQVFEPRNVRRVSRRGCK